MKENDFGFSEQYLITDTLSSVGLFSQEEIANLFAIDVKMKEVSGKHVGLFTSDNIYQGNDQKIKGVWKQYIDSEKGEGRVSEHHHGEEGITEIIIANKLTNYANLPEYAFEIGDYKIHIIKPGMRHGSDEEESSGEWLSIKFKE